MSWDEGKWEDDAVKTQSYIDVDELQRCILQMYRRTQTASCLLVQNASRPAFNLLSSMPSEGQKRKVSGMCACDFAPESMTVLCFLASTEEVHFCSSSPFCVLRNSD